MILSVTLNASVDHALFIDELKIGDTNRVRRTERDAGGKGVNLSRVVAELGAKTEATGFLGGGPGDYVRGELDRQGVSHCFIQVAGDTRINFSVEDGSGNPPTTFNEQGPEISALELESLIRRIDELLPGLHWMCIGGSLPPGVPPAIYADLTRLAHAKGVKVALDADGEPFRLGLEAAPDFIKPNAKEAGRALGRKIDTPEDAATAARALFGTLSGYGAQTPIVVISLGEDGAVMATHQGLRRGLTPCVETHSTIGSGDSLIGGFLWALEQGEPLDESFRWGLACGAATAMTDGSQIGQRPDILRLLPEARVEKL
jgi:1-phosphofructokinase family hexose kinase